MVPIQYRPPDDLSPTVTVVRVSRRIMVFALMFSLVLLGAGVVQFLGLIPSHTHSNDYPHVLTLVGGFGIVASLWRLFSRKPVLVLDDTGLTDHQTGVGLIPWSQLVGARLVHVGLTTYLCLNLIDGAAMQQKRGRFAGLRAGFGSRAVAAHENEVAIPLISLEMGAGEILRRIERYQRVDPGAK